LTDVSPSAQAPPFLSSTNYTLCVKYEGSVPTGATVNLKCDTPYPRGRFLYVIKRTPKGSSVHLQLCEVEVYAHIPSNYHKQHNVGLMQEFNAVCG